MGRGWTYICTHGEELRQTITAAGENGPDKHQREADALRQLDVCLEEIIGMLPESDTDEFRMLKELIADEPDLVARQDPLIQEHGYNSSRDLVDDRLDQFWSLCDCYRVWVAV